MSLNQIIDKDINNSLIVDQTLNLKGENIRVKNKVVAKNIEAEIVNTGLVNALDVDATTVDATNVNADLINGYPYPPTKAGGLCGIWVSTTNQLVGGTIGYEGIDFETNIVTTPHVQKASSHEFRLVDTAPYEILFNLFFDNSTAGGVLDVNLFVNDVAYFPFQYVTSTYNDLSVWPPNLDKYVTYPKLYGTAYINANAGDVIYVGVSGQTIPQPLQCIQAITTMKITKLQ